MQDMQEDKSEQLIIALCQQLSALRWTSPSDVHALEELYQWETSSDDLEKCVDLMQDIVSLDKSEMDLEPHEIRLLVTSIFVVATLECSEMRAFAYSSIDKLIEGLQGRLANSTW